VLTIAIYLAVITYIGKRTSKKIHTEEDFFMAGRTVGKILQYFLNMSTVVDANSAVRTASFAFNKGLGGVWLMLIGIFTGPYYWFMAGWFRRVRLITMAELFEERFKSKFMASIYACVGIWLSVIIIGVGYKTSLRTFEAMTIKPDEKYSAAEKQKVELHQEYRQLNNLYKEKKLTDEQHSRYQILDSMYKKNQISAYISYTDATWFYILYTVFVGMYVIMGGLEATIWNDLIQGILIFVFSAMLIPIALAKLGGWGAFSANIPDHMLEIFGSGLDEFSWNSIAALTLVSIIGMAGHQGNMSNNGSAKDELTARIGNIGGAYTKRVLTIMWAFCGLLAYALYKDSVSDPDAAWGVMSNNLLGVGSRGFMIAGILAANMSTLAGVCVYLSALFVRHLYKPFVKNKNEKHYINISRISIVGVLLLGIYVSVNTSSVINVIVMMPSLMIIFGAPVLLMLFWKRLTLPAVYAQVIITTILFAILPEVLTKFDSVKQLKWLTQQTSEQTVIRNLPAKQEDVEKGIAIQAGQKIKKEFIIHPVSIYYDSVARSNPDDANSPMTGIGRLHTELIIAKTIGLNLQEMKPSMLLTIRYLVASFLPYIILIPVSLFTKNKGLEENIARFYVKMKTRVIADRQLDNAELQKSYDNPTRFDHTKLFPNSDWEFCKWTKEDFWGFIISTALTIGIMAAFWGLIRMIAT
jgi:SSS family solute:Na+ symporter